MKPLKVYQAPGAPRLREALVRGEVLWVDAPGDADLVVSAPPVSTPSAGSENTVLTPREHEILEYLADGWANDEIADRLRITGHTVKFHLESLYRKLGVGRRTEAVREGWQRGLLRL